MNRICYILLFLCAVSWGLVAQARAVDSPFILVIDPGHGGRDPGAVGKKGKEKDINLGVALLFGEYISREHPDVKVVYTRDRDLFVGLDERAAIANKAHANLFVSIHSNATKSNWVGGAEVFTLGIARSKENLEVAKRENSVILMEDNYDVKYEGFDPSSPESNIIFEYIQGRYAEQSIDFASMVQHELVNTSKRSDRGVKQAGYLVLYKSSMPSVLVELDFITNRTCESYLLSKEGQKQMARSLTNAFTKYKKQYDRKSATGDGASAPYSPRQMSASPQNIEAVATVSDKTDRIKKAAKIDKNGGATIQRGRIYKVQILAVPSTLPDNSPDLKGYAADYYLEGNLYKYTIGESSDWTEISNLRKKVAKDFKGAFIVVFEDGVKVAR